MLLLNHTCSVWRNTAVGTNGRRQVQELYSGVRCLVIPMSSQTTIQENMEPGRGFEIHMGPDQDIKVGDKIVWNGVGHYVKYIRYYRDMPPVSHIELVCESGVA